MHFLSILTCSVSSENRYTSNSGHTLNESACQCRLKGESYDEDLMLPLLLEANRRTEIYSLYFNKLILSYLFGEYAAAVENAELAAQYLDGVRSRAVVPCFYFYESLSKLAIYSISSFVEQSKIIQQVTINQKKMAEWARLSPANYRHKFCLIAAEQYRVLGNKADAIDYYDRAIAGARENQFLNEESIANELAAKFYLDWGKEKVAAVYMQEAYYCYERWGAIAKVAELERHYPQILFPILQKIHPSSSIPKTFSYSSGSDSKSLDLETLLRASQAISEEIEIDNLLITLLNIAITNAGADKCVLLLQSENELQIVALVESGQPSQILSSPIPLALSEDVAIGLVNQVKRSLEPLVLSDARQDDQFASDRYKLKYRPKSVLCIPILKQGKLIGVLYLENSLTVGAFTSNRLEVLNLICSQAAISIENARLYQTLHQSENKFRAFVENVNDIIYAVTLEGTFSYLSPQFKDMLGYDVSEFLNQSFGGLTHLDDTPAIIASNQKLFETGQKQSGLEFRVKHKNSEWVWITCNNAPIFDDQGSVIGLRGIARDISERKRLEFEHQQTEVALAESESKFRRLVEGANDMIWSAQADSTLTYLSPQFQTMFGLSPSEWVGESFAKLIHPDDLEETVTLAKFSLERLENLQNIEFRHLCRDGSYLWVTVNITPVADNEGTAIGLQGIIRDISDQKQVELMLQRQLIAVEASLDGIAILQNDNYIYINEAHAQIFGYDSPSELLPKTWRELYTSEEICKFEQDVFPVLMEEKQWRGEAIAKRKDGTTFNEELSLVISENGDLICVCRDISDRKAAEAQLQLQAQQLEKYTQTLEQKVKERTQELSQTLTNLQTTQAELIHSEKMAVLGQLTASIAHEINTPLGVIRAAASNIVSGFNKSLQKLPELLQSLSPQQQEVFLDLVNTSLQNQQTLSTKEERKLRQHFEMALEANGISNFHNIAMQLTLLRTVQDLSHYQSILQSPNCDEILQVAYSMVLQYQSINNIQQEVDRAAKIVFALKTYSHQSQAEEKSLIQISDGIEIALTLYQNRLKQGIEVIRNYETVPDLLCDPDAFTQVWVNLIDNAIFAIGQKGTLEISIAQKEERVVVEITNSGAEIPIESESLIFEPFFTTKPRGVGSGLGLDIVRQIVRKHDGDIQVRSQNGRVTFSIIIPLSEDIKHRSPRV